MLDFDDPSLAVTYFSQVANLLVALVGLAWIGAGDQRRRDVVAFRGWLVFWLGTVAYYAGDIVNKILQYRELPAAPWWVPQVGLYVATAALLTAFLLTEERLDRLPAPLLALAGVGLAAAAGILDTTGVWHARWHQGLTCIAILPWAFRLRQRDTARSVVMALYALIQLPLWQTAPCYAQAGVPFQTFVNATFVLYVVGKVPLISAVSYVIEKPDPALLAPYQLSRPLEGAKPDLGPWQVFISYAFEDVAQARSLRLALEAEKVQAFVASDHLSSLVGTREWAALIDELLGSTRMLVVLVTADSLASRWVQYEWRSVQHDMNSTGGRAIVPVCIRRTAPDGLPRALRSHLAIHVEPQSGYTQCAAEIAARLSNLLRELEPLDPDGPGNGTNATPA